MVPTKKEKTSTMHKQYTLYNSEVHKKTIKMGSKQMQVQRKGMHGRTDMAEVLVPDQFHHP